MSAQQIRNFQFDYLIIGGGPIGLATALLLNKRLPRKRICLIEHRSDYMRDQVLYVNNNSFNTVLEKIDEHLYSQLMQNSCVTQRPPLLKSPLCFSDEQYLSVIKKQNDDEAFLSIKTKYLETTLMQTLSGISTIALFRPNRGKIESKLILKDNIYEISTLDNNLIIETHGVNYYPIEHSGKVRIEYHSLIAADGAQSHIRKEICNTVIHDPELADCMKMPPNITSDNYGMYAVLNLKQISKNFFENMRVQLNDYYVLNSPQNNYRIFLSSETDDIRHMYIALRITNDKCTHIQQKNVDIKQKYSDDILDSITNLLEYFLRVNLYQCCGFDEQFIRPLILGTYSKITLQNFKTDINNLISSQGDDKILLQYFNLKRVVEDSLRDFPQNKNGYDVRQYILDNTIDINCFNATPRYSIFSAKTIGEKNYFFVGDTIINVHFFSGTGVNYGFENVNTLTEILKTNNQRFTSQLEADRQSVIDYNNTNTNTNNEKKLEPSVNIIRSNLVNKIDQMGGNNYNDYYSKYKKYKVKYMKMKKSLNN